jgi:hypothetical protein
MKKYRWEIGLGIFLLFLTILLHYIHYLIFRDARQMLFYMVGDIAFIPIQVLFVTLIITRFLDIRSSRAKMQKLNMAIGAFFSEVGTELLLSLSEFNLNIDELKDKLIINNEWSEEDFFIANTKFRDYEYTISSQQSDLQGLKNFLSSKKEFLLALLGNPNLLEHDRFTDLLWAVFHLMEELDYRKDLSNLSVNDYNHISGDIKRAYSLLIYEWLEYMKHLKNKYPYLYSLAIRTNPFDQKATPEIK